MTAARDPYAEVGKCARAAVARALALDPPPPKHALRVLLALVALVPLYSRIEGRVSLGQLCAFAGGMDRRAVRRGVKWLADNGVIGWSAGFTKGDDRVTSRVTFIGDQGVTITPYPGATITLPPEVNVGSTRGSMLAVPGGHSDPPSEKIFREDLRGEGRPAPGAGAPSAERDEEDDYAPRRVTSDKLRNSHRAIHKLLLSEPPTTLLEVAQAYEGAMSTPARGWRNSIPTREAVVLARAAAEVLDDEQVDALTKYLLAHATRDVSFHDDPTQYDGFPAVQPASATVAQMWTDGALDDLFDERTLDELHDAYQRHHEAHRLGARGVGVHRE